MNSIERDIFIAAPVERVWQIVTEPEHMANWFGDAGASRAGDTITVSWAEHGDGELRIVREDAPHAFAFRWDANDAGIGDTLVEFTLATEGDGTRVKVVESGWGELNTSPERQAELRDGNASGWKHELGDLERYAQTIAV
ncbi:SRPBCC domain-containing protein [Solirubrobacter sp. CPCC 204708]|uniref:SRPBCC domain-containing protein n=1 Tax=Solirubrobacter deserti TaxID=2282478 RepID=A0ABT4RLC5_9ACTN|nr:SRPBCC domain-containing protein [Solirubrobacter deserti]MBE2318954.1 SRPBCC domain-containing protein [Solirubrobacter deserti]MDA0139321.1 SRPBCC domain-containing protein [Solirubrobacter deserti]